MAVRPMLPPVCGDVELLGLCALRSFRAGLYRLLTGRADALFEAVDALLCGGAPRSFAELSLDPVFRRGHGALYDALAAGGIDAAGLEQLLADRFTPAEPGPVMVAFDLTAIPRPWAACCPERMYVHVGGRGVDTQITRGWCYSLAVGLEWGAGSWTAPLSAIRLLPADDATDVAYTHLKTVHAQLQAAGHLGATPWLAIFDAGYDLNRLCWLRDRDALPVQILGRIRSNRVFYDRPAPSGPAPHGGRPARHGRRFALPDTATHRTPDATAINQHPRYGTTHITAWHRLHSRIYRDGPWTLNRHPDQLPIIEGTVVRIQAQHLPGVTDPEPMWLWHSDPAGTAFDPAELWMAYLRRFDIEHTIKFCKRTLGWTLPKTSTPAQQDLWTHLVLAAYTQLRLARTLAEDLPRPWQKHTAPGRLLTPGRTARGFRRLTGLLGTPANPPKPSKAGPGRPQGSTRPPRTRHNVAPKPTQGRHQGRRRARTTTKPKQTKPEG